MSVLVSDDKKIIEMIKDAYLKETILPNNDEERQRRIKLRSNYINFVNVDERKILRS